MQHIGCLANLNVRSKAQVCTNNEGEEMKGSEQNWNWNSDFSKGIICYHDDGNGNGSKSSNDDDGDDDDEVDDHKRQNMTMGF